MTEFERKVVKASLYMERGCPLKDVLDDSEVMDVVQKLADIYVTIFGLPKDLLE